ncbi:hypothetical protein ILUMI_05893 [Ignelater luminosus]|uniref:Uncharacterized protein n=1 Tax=Ignelater luminosus TaxID=2038154 RepID=A0A8K0D6G3_IGNLU|nr:hypothetical protein ILUMI_05893 [Ignelater luminosus]
MDFDSDDSLLGVDYVPSEKELNSSDIDNSENTAEEVTISKEKNDDCNLHDRNGSTFFGSEDMKRAKNTFQCGLCEEVQLLKNEARLSGQKQASYESHILEKTLMREKRQKDRADNHKVVL